MDTGEVQGRIPERLASEILESIADGVYALDRELRFTAYNDACERYFGISRQNILGRVYQEAFPAARGSDLEATLMAALESGQPQQLETVSRITGIPILLRAFPSKEGVTVVFTDVTERHKADLALRNLQEERARQLATFDAVLAPLQEFVSLHGLDGRLRYANRPLLDLWSITLEELVGKDFYDLGYPAELAATLLRQIRQAADTKASTGGETSYVSPRGIEGYYEYTFVPLLAPDGSVESIAGHTRVVTEQRRREADLARLTDESEKWRRLYETVISNTPDLQYVFDLDHRFVFANRALLAMWGKTLEESLGKTCLELGYEPWHAEMHDREIEQVKKTKRPIRGVVPFNGTNGRRMYDYIFVPVLGENGVVEAVAGTTRDVTERMEHEDALRRAKEQLEVRVAERTRDLQEAIRESEGFNYSVSHDLRAPLRAIGSTASILLHELGPHLENEHRDLLERQVANAKRLGRIIDELLRLSRLARAELVRHPLDLTAIAREVAESDIAPGPCLVEIQNGMTADGDPTFVRLLLQNLIGNACKFSPSGGRVQVGQREDCFWVRDEGVGFDMEFAEKIFLPFERLVNGTDFEGTGIGLANVDRIVRRHGGRVWAESQPGKGSTFYFTLSP